MTYNEVLEYIKEKEKIGSVFGLDSIHELLKRLGNPENGIPAIHIAGTNGKGSILSYVEEVLVEAGLKVGRYISPTIFDYRERWRLNKEWASEEDVALAVTEVSKTVLEMTEDGLNSPTAFEIETAAMFILFRNWNVDVMLVECGMGGLLDATNVIEDNVINVMASVSIDHMQILGDTVQKITEQKLGIVRPGTTLVTYPQTEEARDVIREYASSTDVRLIESSISESDILEDRYDGSRFIYKGREFRLSIGGSYQILNAITAIDVLDAFYDEFIMDGSICSMDRDEFSDHMIQGLEKTVWDGRFSIYGNDPVIVVDGAHNRDAWINLKTSLENYFTNEKFVYIIGVLRDKEYNRMVELLSPTAECVICVESENPRALGADELKAAFNEAGVEAESYNTSYRKALDRAMEIAEKRDEVVVICGTLSITGEMIRCIESTR